MFVFRRVFPNCEMGVAILRIYDIRAIVRAEMPIPREMSSFDFNPGGLKEVVACQRKLRIRTL